jgi:glucose-6-phosphate isomerase/transaldolase/glucose-6-phosphate isomerase
MPHVHLPVLETDLRATLDRLRQDRVVDRVWEKDHTLWHSQPTEITNRLGWLDLVRDEPVEDPEIRDLVESVRAEGLESVVLLGMGGSSLGAEALRKSFGRREGFPELHVLDSVHPRWVERVRRGIDPTTTLFLVASKSGTTAEVMAFFKYFWGETAAAVGEANTGRHFCAITDPGTPLLALAEQRGFRQILINPPDIGGRFSVLSRFGLVTAALAGINPTLLLQRGHAMAKRCLPGIVPAKNPGVWLGALLGTAARSGRDQLTLLASPTIEYFGLWAEQLIAESTGKNGTGILPVTGEPQADPSRYGKNRLFVALRFAPQPGEGFDQRVEALRQAGHPVVQYELTDLEDLGGEFFRWELATAVAGHLLGVHPFDQPDVQSAKSEARRLLKAYSETGSLPEVLVDSDFVAALGRRPPPTYIALMAYADQSPAFETAIHNLRHHLLDDMGITTTFGYGPRFLHSTGQFHKGGPEGGLFVQFLAETSAELEIEGEAYGLGVLLKAQAAGDLAALRSKGRRCVRVDLGDDPVAELEKLIDRQSGLAPHSDLPFF